jgi:hypothetical protein
MAYINQDGKAKRAPAIKALLKQYGLKGTLSIDNHSTIVLTVKSGAIDFIGNCNEVSAAKSYGRDYNVAKDNIQINPYWCHEHFTDKAKDFLVAAVAALKGSDYYDNSDIQTDYFNTSHYVSINIGRWNKPYELTA